MRKVLSGKRYQRTILVIDRTKDNKCNRDKGEDMLYIYQLPKYNKINQNYNECEEHLTWMTKKHLFPDWKNVSKGKYRVEMYKGGGQDIGDRGW